MQQTTNAMTPFYDHQIFKVKCKFVQQSNPWTRSAIYFFTTISLIHGSKQ